MREKICQKRGLWFYASAIALLLAISVSGRAEEPQADIISVSQSGNAEGRTVVLIPGLASSADVWDETRPLLEADYDVRTVQIAGFAGAQPISADEPYTDAIAAALVAELETSPAKNTVLVGHSMGGFVSMKAALIAPDMIDELVIVDSVPFLAGLFFPGATPEMAAAQAPVMAAQMADLPREAFDQQQKAGLGRLVRTTDFIPTLAAWGEASDQATVSAITGELMGTDLRANIANMTTETLVLVPHHSVMGLAPEQVLATYEEQFQAAPDARLEMVENSLHFIMIDQPEAFHALLLSALSD